MTHLIMGGFARRVSEAPMRAAEAPRLASAASRVPDRGGPAFAINGRFYGQAMTGVQRYGREIVAALDPLLLGADRTALLVLPPEVNAPAGLRAVEAARGALGSGHGWEQAVLPLRMARPLLNLCNTGPLARQRQVVCIHDTNVFTDPGSYRTGFRLFYGALQPLLARRAAILTTVSHASAAALAARFGLDRRRIAVLPNGHEHARAWARDDSVVLRHGLARPFVLVFGSRARHKNVGLLLGLAPALDGLGIDLVMAGGAGAIFAADSAGGRCNVKHIGRVSDGELAGLLAHALCLAFPSWTEGFGLPIVEAMALGCPVVASDRASMPEVCGPAALMAAPDDPGAWLAHIEALLGSAMLRDELTGRGRTQARRFSWAASARGYMDLMETLA